MGKNNIEMNKTVVINVVGLSRSVIGEYTPFIQNFIRENHFSQIKPVFPAVTTTAQSTYVTGKFPENHGVVGNGWFDRQENEVKFWKQSNALVQAEKIWEKAKQKNSKFTSAVMFWWYNMYLSADYSVTPRPQYHADGVKAPDCYSHPAALRDELQSELGTFPLFNFWGPNANIRSSKWIADASVFVDEKYDPTLSMVYLPHLDYCLQKFGTDFSKIGKELTEIDDLVKYLVTHFKNKGAQVIILSEYGINNVTQPIHINRFLRKHGLINVRTEKGLELLDAGASDAFSVSDHQIAHIYIKDKSRKEEIKQLLKQLDGIEIILDDNEKKAYNLDHERAGDLVLMAKTNSWFTYYYWEDDSKAPDYARLVDIHRKPGYDPVEMFMDPKNPLIKLKAGYKLLRKMLGFRYLMNVIPLDASLVKGSHGAVNVPEEFYPVFISDQPISRSEIHPTEVYTQIWKSIFGQE
jgi:predicted AlkP superfamily pyrophosphatase or phosphodiesterase